MELREKTKEKVSFIAPINVSLANAIRRSVNEIDVLAIKEVDIYKNDSALYDEIIAHRLGLLPIKNQKLKKDQLIEMKLKAKGKKEGTEVLASELDGEVVYPEMPIVLLAEGQVIELVAKAGVGKGIEHSKYSPGVLFYKHMPKVKISNEGSKRIELAELYSKAFEVDSTGKLRVKDAAKLDIDMEDLKDFQGVSVEFDKDLVFDIESWGQIEAKDIFIEACNALKNNLEEVSKQIK